MRKLLQGIVEFRRNVRPGVRETFARLALGQSPDALLVACSDSRVVPNLFASTEPGDLFVVRNVGNLVPASVDGSTGADAAAGAAVEFATLALGVSDAIVCGHSHCGAMRTLLEGAGTDLPPHLAAWLRHAEEPLAGLREGVRMPAELELHDHLSQLNVLVQLEHLRTYPSVAERERTGKLGLHAWWFDVGEAEVHAFDADEGRFLPIDEAHAGRILDRMGGQQ